MYWMYPVLMAGILGVTVTAINAQSSKQATIGVSANVVAACEVGSGVNESGEVDFGTLDFGTHYFLTDKIFVVGQPNGGAMRIKCASGVSYSVLLDGGQSGNTATRYLVGDTGSKVSYNLYKDSSYNSVWDDVKGLAGVGNGQEQWLPVYGVIPVQSTPKAGVYTDTVKVTVMW